MDVFISWSGERSKKAAEALHSWLPKLINAVKPWLSASDIDKGTRWAAKVGIICLTPSNLHSDWILFEAGALSKTIQSTYVCPLLIGLKPSDVTGPLAQFQATRVVKDEILHLVKTINTALGDTALPEKHVEDAFEVWWPILEADLNNLPSENTAQPRRTESDMLEEILAIVRQGDRPRTFLRSRIQAVPTDMERSLLGERVMSVLRHLGIKVHSLYTRQSADTGETICTVHLPNGTVEIPVDVEIDSAELEELVSTALVRSGQSL
jgi:hypothetical protein